jgi:hypothetical protein
MVLKVALSPTFRFCLSTAPVHHASSRSLKLTDSCRHSLSRPHPPSTSSAIITSACSSSHAGHTRRRTQPRVHPTRKRRHLLLLHAKGVERHRVGPVLIGARCRELSARQHVLRRILASTSPARKGKARPLPEKPHQTVFYRRPRPTARFLRAAGMTSKSSCGTQKRASAWRS